MLFDETIQRKFISDILREFEDETTRSTFDPTKFSPLFGTKRTFPCDNPPSRKKSKTCTYFTTTILVESPQDEPESTTTGFDQAVLFYRWLLNTPNQNSIQLTWGILIALYISDAFKDIVCAQTPPGIALEYLKDFDHRFNTYLCGVLKHNKKEKSSTLIKQSKTPTEIVLTEWLFAKQIHTNASNYT